MLGEEDIRSSLSSNDSVGIIGGGFDSENDAHSTGEDGVDVGSPEVASEDEVTPLSLLAPATLRLPGARLEPPPTVILALLALP